MKFKSEIELIDYTRGLIGKTFGEIDSKGLLNKQIGDKGVLGKVVETGHYGYTNNSIAEADFNELGIELKVTGFEVSKKGLVTAKERLSLSMIDYIQIVNEEFEFSKMLFKNKKLLIIWYEYERGKEYADFQIKYFQIYDMCQDLEIIKNDFYIIKRKVQEGKAHLLSEGDTSILGANTKGKSGAHKVQPYSKERAPSRGYCLKNSYMKGILRNLHQDSAQNNPPKYKTVIDYVMSHLSPYIGLTQAEIWFRLFGTDITLMTSLPKQLNKMISDKILGKDEELTRKDNLFTKTTFIIKNLPVKEIDNFPLERLTFKNMSHSDFNLPWDESTWKTYYEEVTFIVIRFEGKKQGERRLKDAVQLSFNQDDLATFEKSYNRIREAIKLRDITLLPVPKSFSGQTLVIAPKGQKGAEAYKTFLESETTKTSFMLEKNFIYKKFNEA